MLYFAYSAHFQRSGGNAFNWIYGALLKIKAKVKTSGGKIAMSLYSIATHKKIIQQVAVDFATCVLHRVIVRY
jgi:hypothetical protein